jgi:hypothetical protein
MKNPAVSNLPKIWVYVKGIIYKTSVTSPNEMTLRIVAAIETVTPKMLENTWGGN